jgi:tetratricopeptide (TPR) repeat protein
MRAHLDGRFTEMAAAAESAWQLGQTAHYETCQGVYAVQLLHLNLETGGVDDLLDGLEVSAAQSPLPAQRLVLALAYAGAGRSAEALAQVELFAGSDFAAVRRDCTWSTSVCWLADVVARFDAVEHAPALYRLLLPFADRNSVAGGAILCLGPISRYLGMLARVNGEYDRALQHLRHALARSRSLGSEPVVARTQLETAKVQLARDADGDLVRARELLAAAAATAEELGMTALAGEVADIERPAVAAGAGV